MENIRANLPWILCLPKRALTATVKHILSTLPFEERKGKYIVYDMSEGEWFDACKPYIKELFQLVMLVCDLHFERNGNNVEITLKCFRNKYAEFANWAIVELFRGNKHEVTIRPSWFEVTHVWVRWSMSFKCYRKCLKVFPTLQVIMPEEWLKSVQKKLSLLLLPELSKLVCSYLPSKRFE